MADERRHDSPIGASVDRVEARDKVTGRARYTADLKLPGMAYAVLVGSAITTGVARAVDTAAAEATPGVLAVITHGNCPAWPAKPEDAGYVEDRFPLSDNLIHYYGQYLAVVVAASREQAEHAASLVRVDYEQARPVPTLDDALPGAYLPQGRFVRFPVQGTIGPDPDGEFANSEAKVSANFRLPNYSHAPMEPNATVAVWRGSNLTVYDSSQSVHLHRKVLAKSFALPAEQVRMIAPLVGGGFGNKTELWAHTLLAAVASRATNRPVQLVLSRKQVFTGTGHQPAMIQDVKIGARNDGVLRALVHETVNATQPASDRPEHPIVTSVSTYAVSQVRVRTRVAKVHMPPSAPMRGPSDAPGAFAVDSAVDELAYQLGIDPLELRRRNHSDIHLFTRRRWSAKNLLECYTIGAEEFGWDRRDPPPGVLRDGDDLVGFGVATAVRGEFRAEARAVVELRADGTAEVRTSTQEIGTATLTMVTQVAAAGLGMNTRHVGVKAGDTNLPEAAPNAGSRSMGGTGSAVHLAADKVRASAIRIAVGDPNSPLHGLPEARVAVRDGRLFDRQRPTRGETYRRLLTRNRVSLLPAEGVYGQGTGPDPHELATFGAHFAEVRINRELPRVRVTRYVGVFDIGVVVNRKAARNQAQGGIAFGIGQALTERLPNDPVSGRFFSAALTDYHVPVNADIPDIDVHFVDKPDPIAHPLGAKGMGEVVSVGVPAAVANAVFHATGRRIRALPITPDKLVG